MADERAGAAQAARQVGQNVGPAGEPQASAPKAVAPAEPPVPRRQSVATKSGACDMRVGPLCAERIGSDLRIMVGKPNRALLIRGRGVGDALATCLARSPTDKGFLVSERDAPSPEVPLRVEFSCELQRWFAEAQLTADDAVIVCGSADLISAVLFAASSWCGGVAVAAVPVALDGVTDVAVTPRPLGYEDAPAMVWRPCSPRLLVCDTQAVDFAACGEGTLLGRAVAVAGAVAEGERCFSELALHAEGLVAGNPDDVAQVMLDIVKARAHILTSTAVAIRQGISYGVAFADGLARALEGQGSPIPARSALLSEGLRFSARLAAAHQGKGADLVYAQDALLDTMGLPALACEVDPCALVDAMRACAYERSNRFMLALPLSLGRVRLTAIDDGELTRNARAWARMSARLARARAARP